MSMSRITLGGVPMEVNPESVKWTFKIKMNDSKAVGGKVIQIIGVTWSDITLTGRFAPNRDKKDGEAWQQQARWRDRVKTLARSAEDKTVPIRFTYPDRKWDFQVFIRELTPITYSVTDVAPEWAMTLFPLQSGTQDIVRGVKDVYIQRLMDGVGWKQTSYNGPTESEVIEELNGLDFFTSIKEKYIERLEDPYAEEGQEW